MLRQCCDRRWHNVIEYHQPEAFRERAGQGTSEMTEPRNVFGNTVAEAIGFLIVDMEDIGISLETVLGYGRNFGFTDDALVSFVRTVLLALMAQGARIIRGTLDEDPFPLWTFTDRYGTEPNDIADRVIAAWQGMDREPDWGDFRFATPDVAEAYQHMMRLTKNPKETSS